MNNTIRVTIVAILCSGCIYPRYFRGPNEIGYDHITLQDSVNISISYMETIWAISKKHSGSSIMINTFDKSKLPIEVNFDSMRNVKTKYFDLQMDKINFSNNGIRKGNTIFFPNSDIYIQLVYRTKNFRIKNNRQYSETQKVWIPSFSIKQGSKEYVTKGFWSVYPKHRD